MCHNKTNEKYISVIKNWSVGSDEFEQFRDDISTYEVIWVIGSPIVYLVCFWSFF